MAINTATATDHILFSFRLLAAVPQPFPIIFGRFGIHMLVRPVFSLASDCLFATFPSSLHGYCSDHVCLPFQLGSPHFPVALALTLFRLSFSSYFRRVARLEEAARALSLSFPR